MKNFTYLFFALLMSVFSWQGAAQISGESCTNPIVVSSLPFNDSGNTSDYGDNYGSSDIPSVAPGAITNGSSHTSYLNGDEVVYAYTPNLNQQLLITAEGVVNYSGMFVFTGCPFDSTVGYHVNGFSGGDLEIDGLPVQANQTYYIVISTWAAPQSTYFTIDIVDATPSCMAPMALATTGLSTTTADIEWTAGSTETAWNISWGTPGYTPGDADELGTDTANLTSYQLAGLTPGTKYDVYVQADCGATDGVSDWTGPLNFTTVCAPIASMSEDFDSYATGSIVPDCWERMVSATSPGSQTISSASPASGTRNIYHYTSSTSNSVIVVLPEFSNIDAGTHWLRFQARVASGTGTLSVGYVTDVTDYDSFTLIEDVIITNTSYGTDSEYTVVVPNTVPAGARLGIKSEANGTSHYWDDVYWEPIPTCLWPTALVATSAFDTIADIEWTAGDTETDWNISWGTPGYTPGDADEIDTASVSNNPEYQITGLTADTHYDVYVQADCGAVDGVSTWAGPLEIFTGYCIPSSTNNTDEIRNFTLSNLNNNSAASEGIDGYSDYSNSVAPAELQAGVPYVASLTSGTGSGNHGAAIWIDLNQNGVFEASEMVTFLPSSIGANATVDFPEFTLPNNTSLDTYRLRVQYHYNKSGEDLDPCVTTSNFSETEDYAITVLAPPSCVPPSALTTTGMSATTVDIGWTAGDTETAWNVSWGTPGYTPGDADEIDTASVSNDAEYQITGLTADTHYDVYVQADCGGDESAWVGPLEVFTGYCVPTGVRLKLISSTFVSVSQYLRPIVLNSKTKGPPD